MWISTFPGPGLVSVQEIGVQDELVYNYSLKFQACL